MIAYVAYLSLTLLRHFRRTRKMITDSFKQKLNEIKNQQQILALYSCIKYCVRSIKHHYEFNFNSMLHLKRDL